MKIIWVLDNIRERKDFYSRLHTLLLLCSVKLWKKFYPDDYCMLYCDSLTKEFLVDLKVECFWNEIKLLKSKKNRIILKIQMFGLENVPWHCA